MTAGELLDAAHSFPFRPLREQLEDRPIGGFRIQVDQKALEKKSRAIAAHRSRTTNLIDDDPDGFRFTQSGLARFDPPYEFFFVSDA